MRKNSRQWTVDSGQKKAILLFAGYCLLVTLLGGCAKREIKNIDSKGKGIICFGDSLTFGYGVDASEAYPAHLVKMADMLVINAGIDGETSMEALKRIEADVLSRNPLLVIIEFGGNDFLRKIPLDVTLNNLREMVDRIQGKGAMAAIVDISAGLLMTEYRTAYQKIAREKKAVFIPSVMTGIITNPEMKSDFFHPNASGYKIIAERIWRFIKPYLAKNSEHS